jgi:hypothetical protein
MKKKIKIALVFFMLNGVMFSQIKKIIIVDKQNNEKVNFVKILDENGNINSVSNPYGIIEVDIKKILETEKKQIETSSFLYETQYFDISKLPDTIKLVGKVNILNEVIVSKRNKTDRYYKLKAYFRSWKLVNNKLQKYAEGLKYFYMPYDKTDRIKDYFTQYTTYSDSLIKKKRTSISFGDGYLLTHIFPEDYYTRHKHIFTLRKNSTNSYDLIEDNAKVGYVKFDENNQISEVNQNDFVADVKMFGKTIDFRYYTFEKWSTNKNRHLLFSRTNSKREIKKKGEISSIETTTEIFIEEEEFDGELKPAKYKDFADKDYSFYYNNFQEGYRKKYPLEKEIELQIKNIKINENKY